MYYLRDIISYPLCYAIPTNTADAEAEAATAPGNAVAATHQSRPSILPGQLQGFIFHGGCPSPASTLACVTHPTFGEQYYKASRNFFPADCPGRPSPVERITPARQHGIPDPQGGSAQHAGAPCLHREGWRASLPVPRHPALCQRGPDHPEHGCRDPSMDQCQTRGQLLPPGC